MGEVEEAQNKRKTQQKLPETLHLVASSAGFGDMAEVSVNNASRTLGPALKLPHTSLLESAPLFSPLVKTGEKLRDHTANIN